MNPLDELAVSLLPGNTLEARRALSHLPPSMWGWVFARYPGDLGIAGRVQGWLASFQGSAPPGLVLHGPSGAGKTGLMAAAVNAALEQRIGSLAWWNLMTAPSYREALADGRLRPRPAPVWFESWTSLRDRLKHTWRPMRGEDESDAPGGEEALLAELDERVTLLAVDDIDVDAMSDWKESVLLRLLAFPGGGRRLLVTTNVPLRGFLARFGERCADRLLDPEMFFLVEVPGRSLRRRL